VLLKVLLIELVGCVGRRVDPSGAGAVMAHVERAGPQRVWVRNGVPAELADEAHPRLGLALCTEIAREMDGEFEGRCGGDGLFGVRLGLPARAM